MKQLSSDKNRSLIISQTNSKVKRAIKKKTSDNKLVWTAPNHNRRENVHSFFQYPAMMVPSVQMELMNVLLKIEPNIKNIFDPYMGSATTLIAGMNLGLNCYGQDINPLAILIAKVKTGPYWYNNFKNKSELLLKGIEKDRSKKYEINFTGRNKWFTPKTLIELSKIRRNILKETSKYARRFLWVTLAETVRLTSNDRTSTFKLHSRPIDEIKDRYVSPTETFQELIEGNLIDLKKYKESLEKLNLLRRGHYKGEIIISLLDSTREIIRQDELLFDAVITSPPYGDNKTTIPYGQHSYLPLQWIPFEDICPEIDDAFLKSTSEIDNRSIGGKLRSLTIKEKENLFNNSPTLKSTILYLNRDHDDKIDKVLNFIYDINASLDQILIKLKNQGYLVFTIGNRRVGGREVKNSEILKELLASKNVKLITEIERKILNKRMAKKNNHSKTMSFEKILIFRKT